MAFYRLLVGEHEGKTTTVLRDGVMHARPAVRYKKGEIIESETDLVAKFPGKFERYVAELYAPPTAKPVAAPQPQPAAPATPATPPPNAAVVDEPDGPTEVTEEFTEAAEADLKVLVDDAGRFTLTDKAGTIINAKPLTRAKMVKLIETVIAGN